MRLICPFLFAVSAIALLGSTHSQFCWTEGTRRLEVNSRGTVEFSDDDRDVKSLSPGGYFRVEENYLLLFGGRRYEVTADGSGRLTRTYFDHDRARQLDSQGQAWLMGIMPGVIRKSGLGAVQGYSAFCGRVGRQPRYRKSPESATTSRSASISRN